MKSKILNGSIFGISLETFKTPAAMLLLGMVIAGGGATGMFKWFGFGEQPDNKKVMAMASDMEDMKEDREEFKKEVRTEIREVREGQIKQREQIRAVSRQLDRIERKLDPR